MTCVQSVLTPAQSVLAPAGLEERLSARAPSPYEPEICRAAQVCSLVCVARHEALQYHSRHGRHSVV
jgi:hypothetical protein